MKGDRSALKRRRKSGIAEPYLRESHEISSYDDIDTPVGNFEADLDIFGSQHQPPIARAAAGFGYAVEIEAHDETLRGNFGWIDLPAYSLDERFGIKVVGTYQPLSPALAPDAQQLDNRPEFLSGRRQSVKVTFALGFRLNVDHTGLPELLETLRQDCAISAPPPQATRRRAPKHSSRMMIGVQRSSKTSSALTTRQKGDHEAILLGPIHPDKYASRT